MQINHKICIIYSINITKICRKDINPKVRIIINLKLQENENYKLSKILKQILKQKYDW